MLEYSLIHLIYEIYSKIFKTVFKFINPVNVTEYLNMSDSIFQIIYQVYKISTNFLIMVDLKMHEQL